MSTRERNSSSAGDVASSIAALVAAGQVLEHPLRAANVSWREREELFPDQETTASRLRDAVRSIGEAAGSRRIHVAVEGVCRVMLGGRSGGRGTGERFTALVIHVIADGEPVRTVILPLE